MNILLLGIVLVLHSLVPSPTPSFSSLAVRGKAGRGTGNEAKFYMYIAICQPAASSPILQYSNQTSLTYHNCTYKDIYGMVIIMVIITISLVMMKSVMNKLGHGKFPSTVTY